MSDHLGDRLKKRSIVVFYDPRREFEPFFARELEPQEEAPLPRVTIGGHLTYLARHAGTYFGLRTAVEPVVGHSFWVDRDVRRQAKWETCRLMAELGQAVERIRPELSSPSLTWPIDFGQFFRLRC